ncbi:MAG: hypothetical protein HZA52_14790 [Planctomycetes bacterium]|nr:hypothetical protein [Planctomycetota bacterium]
MQPTRIAITGFGAFRGESDVAVVENPSRAIAFALEREPPPGVQVVAAELSVTFERAPRELERWLAGLDAPPAALLGLGVQSRGGVYRLERRARARLEGDRRDNDGRGAGEATAGLTGDLATELDLARLAVALRVGGASDVLCSDDAGGFVCERVYHALLERGRSLGVPAVFLHLPTVAQAPIAEQTRIVRALVIELARLVAPGMPR